MEATLRDLTAILDIRPPLLWVSELTLSVSDLTFSGMSNFDESFWAFGLHSPNKRGMSTLENGTPLGALPGMFGVEALAQCSAAALSLYLRLSAVPIICRSRATFVKPIGPGELSIKGAMKIGESGWSSVNAKGYQGRSLKVSATLDYQFWGFGEE